MLVTDLSVTLNVPGRDEAIELQPGESSLGQDIGGGARMDAFMHGDGPMVILNFPHPEGGDDTTLTLVPRDKQRFRTSSAWSLGVGVPDLSQPDALVLALGVPSDGRPQQTGMKITVKTPDGAQRGFTQNRAGAWVPHPALNQTGQYDQAGRNDRVTLGDGAFHRRGDVYGAIRTGEPPPHAADVGTRTEPLGPLPPQGLLEAAQRELMAPGDVLIEGPHTGPGGKVEVTGQKGTNTVVGEREIQVGGNRRTSSLGAGPGRVEIDGAKFSVNGGEYRLTVPSPGGGFVQVPLTPGQPSFINDTTYTVTPEQVGPPLPATITIGGAAYRWTASGLAASAAAPRPAAAAPAPSSEPSIEFAGLDFRWTGDTVEVSVGERWIDAVASGLQDVMNGGKTIDGRKVYVTYNGVPGEPPNVSIRVDGQTRSTGTPGTPAESSPAPSSASSVVFAGLKFRWTGDTVEVQSNEGWVSATPSSLEDILNGGKTINGRKVYVTYNGLPGEPPNVSIRVDGQTRSTWTPA